MTCSCDSTAVLLRHPAYTCSVACADRATTRGVRGEFPQQQGLAFLLAAGLDQAEKTGTLRVSSRFGQEVGRADAHSDRLWRRQVGATLTQILEALESRLDRHAPMVIGAWAPLVRGESEAFDHLKF
ncbi:hypothetical protein ACTMTI_52815 [Nonomuraea sp. H19]|uniref:hypothetical protein n=1 Tax=Nonomuraea sp. H19 TaxID=3452206 RepID=UPI003F8B6223